jgi:hypothetical protein
VRRRQWGLPEGLAFDAVDEAEDLLIGEESDMHRRGVLDLTLIGKGVGVHIRENDVTDGAEGRCLLNWHDWSAHQRGVRCGTQAAWRDVHGLVDCCGAERQLVELLLNVLVEEPDRIRPRWCPAAAPHIENVRRSTRTPEPDAAATVMSAGALRMPSI